MMSCKMMEMIQWVYKEQGSEIMALWLHDLYIWLGFSPKAAKLLVREHGLDSPEAVKSH